MKRSLSLCVLFALAAGIVGNTQANILYNGFMEIDDNGDGAPDGWGLESGVNSTAEWIIDAAQANEGNVSVHLRAGVDGVAMAIPTITAVNPGSFYNISAKAKDLLPGSAPSVTDPEFKLEFYTDAAGGAGNRNDALTQIIALNVEHNGAYDWVGVGNIGIPNGIAGFLLIPHVSNSTLAGESDYQWDKVKIALVPEPATMLLLGVGGLLLRRRRA